MPTIWGDWKIDSKWCLSIECWGNVCQTDSVPLDNCLGINQAGYLGTLDQDGFDFLRINVELTPPTVDENDGKTMRWTNPQTKAKTVINLNDMFDLNEDGHIVLSPKVPAVMFVPKEKNDDFLAILRKNLEAGQSEDPIVEWAVAPSPSGPSKPWALFRVKTAVETEGHIPYFKTFNANAQAAVFDVITDTNNKAEKIDLSILQGKIEAMWGTWTGYEAGLNLISGQVSVFDIKIGAGTALGVGFRNESVEVEAGEIGFTFGKRVGISIGGSSVEINFGRFL